MSRAKPEPVIESLDEGYPVPMVSYALRWYSRAYRIQFDGTLLRAYSMSTKQMPPDLPAAELISYLVGSSRRTLEISPSPVDQGRLGYDGCNDLTAKTTFAVIARTLVDGIAGAQHLSAHKRLQLRRAADAYVDFATHMVELHRAYRRRLEGYRRERAEKAGAPTSRRSYPAGTIVRVLDPQHYRYDGEAPTGRFAVVAHDGKLLLQGLDGFHRGMLLRRARGMSLIRAAAVEQTSQTASTRPPG